MLGSVQEVLVNGRSKKSDIVFSGRTENNRVVNFSGEESLIGTMVKYKDYRSTTKLTERRASLRQGKVC